MTYFVVKTIKGRRYLYAQRSWREGKKVRTRSRSLGPLGGGRDDVDHLRGLHAAERFVEQIEKQQRARWGETAAERSDRETQQRREAELDKLHEQFGLRMPDDVGRSGESASRDEDASQNSPPAMKA